jgi:hypothetical protein
MEIGKRVSEPLFQVRTGREEKVSVAIVSNEPIWLDESIRRFKVVHGRRPADLRLQHYRGRRRPLSFGRSPGCLGQSVKDRKPFSFELTASTHGRSCCGD